MTFTQTTTDATDRSSIVRGDVAFISGQWAGSTGTARIVTGGSTILGYGVTITNTVSGTAAVFAQKNVDGDGNTEAGTIGLRSLNSAAGSAATVVSVNGEWWAVTVV